MDQHNDRTHGRTGEKATGADEVADYLELEEHLQMLQAGRRPRRPRRMTPGKAAALLSRTQPVRCDCARRSSRKCDARARGGVCSLRRGSRGAVC